MPFNIQAEFNKALQFHRSGRLREAGDIYRKILEIKPDHADSLHLMGVIASQAGNYGLAVKLMQGAIEINPGVPVYHNNIGNAFKARGDLERAVESYRKALELRPGFVEALVSMGAAYGELGRLDEAISCLEKALKINKDFPDAHYNKAIVLKAMNRIDEAIACYQKCIELNPRFSDAHYNLGGLYRDAGRFDLAVSCYRKAVETRPSNADAHYNLGVVLQESGDLGEAVKCYERAIDLNPAHDKAFNNLGTVFKETGRPERARHCYQKSLEIIPKAGIEIQAALVFPVVFPSREAILSERARLTRGIDRLMEMNISLSDPAKEVGTTSFYLAYHGLDNRSLQEKLGRLYLKACPDLAWTSPRCGSGPRAGSRIRIGILSRFFYEHTIGRLNLGIVEGLSREKFHVKVFRFQKNEDALTRDIDRAAHEVVVLPDDLAAARETVGRHDLDILFYPEIGMDPLTYFLAFSRLAPVQCATWGHPVTTGIPNMDYYLSPGDAEPPDPGRNYSESLVPMKKFPMFCPRPENAERAFNRKQLGLPEGHRLYVCPQTLFKFHPDFDEALAAILRRDRKALLILFETKQGHLARLLRERFAAAFGDVVDRVVFLPRMPKRQYLSFLKDVDLLLDTPHFTGGFTSLIAFALGIPIVTWPGRFMCGRLTLGLYRQMGVMDCVAHDAHSYAEIAIRLANDREWRCEVGKRILERSSGLYGDMEAVRELENIFERVGR